MMMWVWYFSLLGGVWKGWFTYDNYRSLEFWDVLVERLRRLGLADMNT